MSPQEIEALHRDTVRSARQDTPFRLTHVGHTHRHRHPRRRRQKVDEIDRFLLIGVAFIVFLAAAFLMLEIFGWAVGSQSP